MPEAPKAKSGEPRRAGGVDRKALRDRLRSKGGSRGGGSEARPDMVGQSGGGP